MTVSVEVNRPPQNRNSTIAPSTAGASQRDSHHAPNLLRCQTGGEVPSEASACADGADGGDGRGFGKDMQERAS